MRCSRCRQRDKLVNRLQSSLENHIAVIDYLVKQNHVMEQRMDVIQELQIKTLRELRGQDPDTSVRELFDKVISELAKIRATEGENTTPSQFPESNLPWPFAPLRDPYVDPIIDLTPRTICGTDPRQEPVQHKGHWREF